MRSILLPFGFLALVAGWLLPGHYPPWVSYQQQWISALGAALLAMAAVAGLTSGRIRWPAIAVFFALLSLIPLAQLAWGQIRFASDGAMPAAYLVAFAMSVAAGAFLAEQLQLQWLDALASAILVAAFASVLIALVQWLQLSESIFIAPLPAGDRPFGNLAQPNHLATLLCLGVTCVVWFFERRRLNGLSSSMLVGWLGWGIVMTQSRTSWLFVVALVVWWAAMRSRIGLRLGTKAVAWSVLFFVLGVVCWTPINRLLLLSGLHVGEHLQSNLRLLHWATLLDAVGHSPWLGFGWLQVTRAQELTALSHPASHEMLQDSHNVVIDLMVWAGIPVALLTVGVVAVWLVLAIRRCRQAAVWILLASIAAILTHALLEFPLDFSYFLLPLGLLMGSVEGYTGGIRLPPWPRWSFAAPLAGMVALLFFIGQECTVLEDSSRQLRFFMAGIGTDQAASVPPPDVRLLDAPREYHRYWLTTAREGMSDQQLDWMRDVSQRNAFPPAMLRYALAAGLNGRASEAARTLALLCSLHPKKRCDEGRISWASAQAKYPRLQAIAMPVEAAEERVP